MYPPKGQVLVILAEDQRFAKVLMVTGDQGECRMMIGHVIEEPSRRRRATAPSVTSDAPSTPSELRYTGSENETLQRKFDRNAYQREYMRKRRAALRD